MSETERWDFVIVGAGIAGLSLAEALTRKSRAKVMLIDSARAGSGASSRNVGRLTHAGCTSPQKAELARDSRNAIAELQQRLKTSAFVQILGEVTVLYQATEIEQFEKQVLPAMRQAGLRARMIPAHEIERHIPDSDFRGAVGAFVTPETSALHPDALLQPLWLELLRRKVQIREYQAVEDFALNGNSIVGVVVGGRTIRADQVILCCGSLGADFVARVGWHTPMKVVRQQAIVTEPVRYQGLPVIRWTGPVASGQCHRTVRGELVAACQHPRGESIRNNNASGSFLTRTARELHQHLPGVRNVSIIRQWSGQTTLTADHMPYAGKVPDRPGLWALYGMNSFTMYPLFADRLAQVLLGKVEHPSLAHARLSPERGVCAMEKKSSAYQAVNTYAQQTTK